MKNKIKELLQLGKSVKDIKIELDISEYEWVVNKFSKIEKYHNFFEEENEIIKSITKSRFEELEIIDGIYNPEIININIV